MHPEPDKFVTSPTRTSYAAMRMSMRMRMSTLRGCTDISGTVGAFLTVFGLFVARNGPSLRHFGSQPGHNRTNTQGVVLDPNTCDVTPLSGGSAVK